MGGLHHDFDNPEVCDEFEEKPFELDHEQDTAPFFLALRGACTFTHKVRNLEHVGVSVVIIIDNQMEDFEKLVLTDDGSGGAIAIPSLMISKYDGEKLLDYIKRASSDERKSIKIMADFDMKHPDNRVEYDVFYSSAQDKALDFFYDFASTDDQLGDSVLMTPRLVYWQCTSCDQEYKDQNCICGGRYCAVDVRDYSGDERALIGKEIVMENLREKCIHKIAYQDLKIRNAFWNYMKMVHRGCYRTINAECYSTVAVQMNLPIPLIQQCVEDSFTSANHDSEHTLNNLIEDDLKYAKAYGTGVYPQISINYVKFRGNLDALNVFNGICAGFKKVPEVCETTQGLVTIDGLKKIQET